VNLQKLVGAGMHKKRATIGKIRRAAFNGRLDHASTMNELINIIVQKTGISQENAQKSAQAVVDFLKSKLPAPVAAQLDLFLSGGTSGGVNALTEQAGGFLKGKLSGVVSAKA
jgi:hypothetical protein